MPFYRNFFRAPHGITGADFDGSNDLMKRGGGLSGAADGKQFILSFWFRLDGGDGADQIIFGSTPTGGSSSLALACYRHTDNTIVLQADNSSGTTILATATTASYTSSATWHHLLTSIDMANAAGSFIYVDDADVSGGAVFTNDVIDFTPADWMVGAQDDAGAKLNGCLAELYFNTSYMDISVTANRRKFISASGKPVSLNTDGSGPTGSKPLVYLSVPKGIDASSFATNHGTGGSFNITGTLTASSTSPND